MSDLTTPHIYKVEWELYKAEWEREKECRIKVERQRDWLLRRVIINRYGEIALADARSIIRAAENLRRLNQILKTNKKPA